jgi:aspartyl-tRNA synthetase
MHPYLTHTCGELRTEHDGKTVRISGWLFRKRDHGGVLFFDLRDHYGVTQVIIRPSRPFFDLAQKVKPESVLTVTGAVERRSPDTVNPDLPTGEVEVVADELVVEGAVEQPLPLQVAGEDPGPEDLRLRYRFLDLRREPLHGNIVRRSRIVASLRQRMIDHGFTELQTPILTSSSPEGARDYLVPSRLHPGKFYALPQAPQIFKQLYMIAGFDRYFQIAPCFRDEDARADRSPGEFYQLDVEMSFVTQEDVFAVIEDVLHGVFCEFATHTVDAKPFRRIPYAEALVRYGTDKPDLRIPLEILDVTESFRESKFNVFRKAVAAGSVVRALRVPAVAGQPRSWFDKLVEYAQSLGSKGLAYVVWEGGVAKGPVAKALGEDETAAAARACGAVDGDAVFFVCDAAAKAAAIMGDLRVKLGRDLNLVEKNAFRFCWVVDFPMFERDPETNAVGFSHNPFSMPQGGMEALLTKDPLTIKAHQYDIVCNGVELSSGAIRNHLVDVMYKAFEIAGYPPSTVDEKFPSLVNAFKFGAPPHGGIAPGVDRIVMLLSGESNIREVIAFPMNQRAQDLMMGAPSAVSERQLRDLHIRVHAPKPAAEPPPTAQG